MIVMTLFSTSLFAKCLRVGEDGPARVHLCHTDTFLVEYILSLTVTAFEILNLLIIFEYNIRDVDDGWGLHN